MDALWITALIKAITSSMIYLSIGLLLLKSYQTHAYLYRLDLSQQNLNNWLDFVVPVARLLLFQRYEKFLRFRLLRSGYHRYWTPERFVSAQMLASTLLFTIGVLFFKLLLGLPWLVTVGLTLLPWLLAPLKLHETVQARLKSCRRDISYFLDYLTLAMSAGMEFSQALEIVVDNAPISPLRDEMNLLSNDLKLGRSKADALQAMEHRLETPEIKTFVHTMIQALRLGTNISETLMMIAENINNRRFQAAEEEAGKISVRMMLPLIIFVLPCVLILVLGPMVISFVAL